MPLAHLSKSEAKKYGVPKKSIQTIIFKKDAYTLKESREWLKKHGYLYQNYRQHRLRRHSPLEYEKNYRRLSTALMSTEGAFQQNNPISYAEQ